MANLMDRSKHYQQKTAKASAPGNRHTRVQTGKGPQSNAASQIPGKMIEKALVIWEEKGDPVVG